MTKQTKNLKVKNNNSFGSWMKKNWKIVVIFILLIFSFSKCTSSCSNKNKVKVLTEQIDSLNTVNDSIRHDNEILQINQNNLNARLSDEQQHSSDFAGIATGNQKELSARINELTTENRQLKRENTELKNKIKELQN